MHGSRDPLETEAPVGGRKEVIVLRGPQGRGAHGRAYGGGFLRLMQFHPGGGTVAIRTYSPWYDRRLTAPDQQFDVRLG